MPTQPARRVLPQDSAPSSGGGVTSEKIKSVVEIMLRRNWKAMTGPDGPIAVVDFKIMQNGQVGGVTVNRSAGLEAFDQACVSAVKSVGPFPPLPAYLGMDSIPMVASFHSGKKPFVELVLANGGGGSGSASGIDSTPAVPEQTASAGSLTTSQPAAQHPPSHSGGKPPAGHASSPPSHQASGHPAGHPGGKSTTPPAGGNLNDHLLALNNQAVIAINDSNYEAAIQKLEEALKVDPSYRTAQSNLAIAYNNYGLQLRERPKDAIKIFHKALALDPTNDKTRTNLDTMIAYLGKDAKSFKDRVALADQALSEGDKLGAKLEFEAALAIKQDPEIQQKLQALISGGAPSGGPTGGGGGDEPHVEATGQTPPQHTKTPPKSTPAAAKTPGKPATKVAKSTPPKSSAPEASTESGGNTRSGGEAGPGGEKLDTIYRNLNSLEQRTFSRTFENEDILARIGRLEKKILGKVQSGKPLRRVDTLLMSQ
ncbi:MAG: TonB family protein [Cyanobacteria bacterium]|nr:TonB family protein [Cyanobacteriota bacterium]